jgi:uncharacterized protein YndB with AHSA1/START domain
VNDIAMLDAYGILTEPATLTIQRLLPGPVERVWSYLTDGELRRKWLASGAMDAKAGTGFELVWRNDELTDPPGKKPEGFGEEHRLACEVTECDPPRRLSFTWGSTGGVSFDLEQRGSKVLLTLTHRRLPDRNMLLMVSAGWHAHLDILAARLEGRSPQPFWDDWSRLKGEYDKRLPAQI